ncbi:hypothetical protein IG631_16784 [Alternaria alternata]|nr:hypothetical protein IG631_16784 [Alternaria alternata]
MASVQITPQGSSNASMDASWSAAASWLSALPDLMDAGLSGAATVAVGSTAPKFFPNMDVSNGRFTGIGLNQVFWAFNTTPAAVQALVQPVLSKILASNTNNTSTNTSLVSTSMTASHFANYTAFFSVISGDNVAGGESLTSSRLLGRPELTHTPHEQVVSYLKTAMASQNTTDPGNYATIGLSGGPGVHSTPSAHWGALHPGWRRAYLHFIATGATVDSKAAGSAKKALQIGADWHAKVKEPMWEKWAPGSGAYMNEANPFMPTFQQAFYGSNYEALREVKRKAEYSTYSALAVTGKLLLPSTLALLLLVQLLLLLLLNLLGTVLRICSVASALVLSLGVQLARIQRHGAGYWAEVVGADVRRVDSLPAVRAIDWEKAARWTKAMGARRVAKARMADMASFVGGVYVEGVVVCGVSAV